MSRLTSSFTCQLISVIITTLVIHHAFTLSLQAQNLPFQQSLPTLILLPLDCLHDHGTGPDLSCLTWHRHTCLNCAGKPATSKDAVICAERLAATTMFQGVDYHINIRQDVLLRRPGSIELDRIV